MKKFFAAALLATSSLVASVTPAAREAAPVNTSVFDSKAFRKALLVDDLAYIKSVVEQTPEAVNARFEDNNTPLMFASIQADTGRGEGLLVVEYLLSKGADVRLKNDHGFTAIHAAAKYGQAITIHRLAKKGADVNERTKNAITPLMLAAHSPALSSKDISTYSDNAVMALLHHGAKVNETLPSGMTALHIVALDGDRTDISQSLIRAGADVNARFTLTLQRDGKSVTIQNMTALMAAVARDDAGMSVHLLRYGADLSLRNSLGENAYDIAEKVAGDVLHIFKEYGVAKPKAMPSAKKASGISFS